MQSIQQSAPCFEPDVPAVYSLHSDTTRSLHGAAVHANQVRSFDVLAARFPVIRRLVGEMSFRIVARRFILREPPDVRTPSGYGENFPRFLRSHGRAASIEYVADIAELEMVRGRAHTPRMPGRSLRRPYHRCWHEGPTSCWLCCIPPFSWSNRVSRS
jgi:hypothetical protein